METPQQPTGDSHVEAPEVKITSSFDGVNAQQSALIYRQFVQGKVITKMTYHDIRAELEENPLFTLLFNHQQHFNHLYLHLGYELCFEQMGDFFYVRELREDASEEADDNALKVQTTLLLLGRYYSGSGRDLNLLCDHRFGLNEVDVEKLKENDEFNAILKAVRLDNWDKALDFICVRQFAFKISNKQLFLSQAGKGFLMRLVDQYQGES